MDVAVVVGKAPLGVGALVAHAVLALEPSSGAEVQPAPVDALQHVAVERRPVAGRGERPFRAVADHARRQPAALARRQLVAGLGVDGRLAPPLAAVVFVGLRRRGDNQVGGHGAAVGVVGHLVAADQLGRVVRRPDLHGVSVVHEREVADGRPIVGYATGGCMVGHAGPEGLDLSRDGLGADGDQGRGDHGVGRPVRLGGGLHRRVVETDRRVDRVQLRDAVVLGGLEALDHRHPGCRADLLGNGAQDHAGATTLGAPLHCLLPVPAVGAHALAAWVADRLGHERLPDRGGRGRLADRLGWRRARRGAGHAAGRGPGHVHAVGLQVRVLDLLAQRRDGRGSTVGRVDRRPPRHEGDIHLVGGRLELPRAAGSVVDPPPVHAALVGEHSPPAAVALDPTVQRLVRVQRLHDGGGDRLGVAPDPTVHKVLQVSDRRDGAARQLDKVTSGEDGACVRSGHERRAAGALDLARSRGLDQPSQPTVGVQHCRRRGGAYALHARHVVRVVAEQGE